MPILFRHNEISPIPARTIADLELEERVYKPDFEITARYQAFSKELVRISLLGLAVYGFLIKLGTEQSSILDALRKHSIIAALGVVAFASCAAFALIHGFLATKCLGYQLIISRYFARLEGDRWEEKSKESFRGIIRQKQREQKSILQVGNSSLLVATIALIGGATMVALC